MPENMECYTRVVSSYKALEFSRLVNEAINEEYEKAEYPMSFDIQYKPVITPNGVCYTAMLIFSAIEDDEE